MRRDPEQFRATVGWSADRSAWLVDWDTWYAQATLRSDAVVAASNSARGLSYGPDPRQVVNLHLPDEPPRDVVAFVHGGGLRNGHPSYYDFLAEPYLAAGIGFASVGYRLVPEVEPSHCVEDVAAALSFVRSHLESLHGLGVRLAVAGHSAGAIIVSVLALTNKGAHRSGLADDDGAVVLVSGVYDSTYIPAEIAILASADPGARHRVERAPARLVIAASSHEENRRPSAPRLFIDQALALAEVVDATCSTSSTVVTLTGDHTRTAEAIGDSDSALFETVLDALSTPHRSTPASTSL